MSKDNKISYVDLVRDCERVAAELEISPYQLKKLQYFDKGRYSEWDFRKVAGGFVTLVRDAFGQDEEKDVGSIRGNLRRRLYVNQLERELGDWEYFLGRFALTVREAIAAEPIQVVKPKPFAPAKETKHSRTIVGQVSDTHFGIRIDQQEVEGPGYDWVKAARRFGKFISALSDYKKDHRKEVDALYLCVLGDICQGDIHPQDHNIDLLTYQIVGAARYLIAGINHLLQSYPRIDIVTTPDNHMRIINHVLGKERARVQKYNSYNTIMFEIVQQAFAAVPNVVFHIPKTPYTTFKIYKHTHFATHLDTVFEVGNPSGNLDVKKIVAKIDALNATRRDSDKIKVVQGGHIHTGLRLMLDSGADLVINPSMSGIDPYAQSRGWFDTRIAQSLWEETPDYPIGDFRFVELKDADKDASYDAIIKPFNYDLIAEKAC